MMYSVGIWTRDGGHRQIHWTTEPTSLTILYVDSQLLVTYPWIRCHKQILV